MEKYIVRWYKRGGVEYPAVVVNKDRHLAGHTTKSDAIAACLKSQRRSLERARDSVLAHERYIAQLEALAERATP